MFLGGFVGGVVGLFCYVGVLKKSKGDGGGGVLGIVGLGSRVLGVWVIMMGCLFVGVVMYVLGIVLVLGGMSELGKVIGGG